LSPLPAKYNIPETKKIQFHVFAELEIKPVIFTSHRSSIPELLIHSLIRQRVIKNEPPQSKKPYST
jgi:hypothetical protein